MRRPWWLWLATASFVAYFLFLNASLNYTRRGTGMTTAPTADAIFITHVFPNSAAARAGMQDGDRIVSANGLAVTDPLDAISMMAALPVNTATPWVVERNGARHQLTLQPLPRLWIWPRLSFLIIFLVMLATLLLGIVLAWRGDGTPTTMLAACLLAALGCSTLPLLPPSMAAEWAALPLPIGLLIWPAAACSVCAPALMFTLAAVIPRPVMPPRLLAVALLPISAVIVYILIYVGLIVYTPSRAVSLPAPMWFLVAGPATFPAYFISAAMVLARTLHHTADVTERRRVRTLMAGTIAGSIGLTLIASGYVLLSFGQPNLTTVIIIGALLFVTLPICFAYATLRHRLFDLRVIVRMGLQYALARGFIAQIIPVTMLVMFINFMRQRERPIDEVMMDNAWVYLGILAMIGIVHQNRERWMHALDRRFFRERYAAQQILKDVVADIGRSASLETAAQKVVSRIDSALHPVMTAVMLRPRTATAFSSAAKHPETSPISSLLAGHAISQVVRALGRPVVFGTQGLRDMPADQQAWLAESKVEVVVPIATDASKDEALLVLGPRKSEEPYSQEDLDLLAAIGASLGLLIGRVTPADAPTMTSVSAARIANRYRIERPIGEGGMGVVFAAIDETLERRVAIKVIKDQHLHGDSLARFQREARTAASLSHPNIVTVHDFGVDDTGAPFLVMELLEGQSLRMAIKTEGRIAQTRAIAILRGLAAAVEAAHAKGVIHRDLKPENVFLIGDTHAKILDYGIAKAVQSKTTFATPGVLGTLAYMAPEQAGGGEASPAWDMWALAVIAYEMLTGEHPFGGGLPVTRAAPIKTRMPEIADDLAKEIDGALALSIDRGTLALR
ncbi:MAG: protein kinase [Cyanobacteria bacterium]|nr:protein kinase [Cyanobacteriota bacterium]